MATYATVVIFGLAFSLTGCVLALPPSPPSTTPAHQPDRLVEIQIVPLEPLGLKAVEEIPDGPQLPVHATDGFGLTKAN